MEGKAMLYEELMSKKFEAYQKFIDSKTKKKKKGKATAKKPAAAKKEDKK